MKKFLIMGGALFFLSTNLVHVAFAGSCGDSFAGSLGGSFLGSAIGTSMASRPSNNGGDDGRALRAVDRLEDIMRRDLQTLNRDIQKLNEKISKLERRLARFEGSQERTRVMEPQ